MALLGVGVAAGAGCRGELDLDSDELPATLAAEDGPTVELDPGRGLWPRPHDLAPAEAPPCDADPGAAERAAMLSALDGFGTFGVPLTFTTSAAADVESLSGRVHLFRIAAGEASGAAGSAAAQDEVPLRVRPAVVARSAADCSRASLVHAITAVPEAPLLEASSYVVAVTAGLTASGEPLLPSPTWALVREADNPVTLRDGRVVLHRTPFDPAAEATALETLDALWRFHRPAMGFLTGPAGLAREDVLLAWTFTTQTVAVPFDPAEAGSPASMVPGAPLTELETILVDPVSGAPVPVSQVLEDALGLDPGACELLGCEAVGDILRGRLAAPRYTTETPNPTGTGPGPAGAWDDPLRPSAQRLDSLQISVVLPAKTVPAAGCPTVVFSHDAGRSRDDLFAVAPALAAAGLCGVAIDGVAHGSRAVRVRDSGACASPDEGLDPAAHPWCYAPLIGADLAATRDRLRQWTLDHMALFAALRSCGTTGCGPLRVDPDRLGSLGHGLGGAVGMIAAAMDGRIGAVVASGTGAGLVDLIEGTRLAALRCSMVDGLLASGVLDGVPYDPHAQSGACTGDAFVGQVGWQRFAADARPLLDAADPVNYVRRLDEVALLVQQIAADPVTPAGTTETLASAAGFERSARALADVVPEASTASAGPGGAPSRALDTGSHHWLLYDDLEADAAAGIAGNRFAHDSLLGPGCAEPSACEADFLGSARVQLDAAAFLANHLTP